METANFTRLTHKTKAIHQAQSNFDLNWTAVLPGRLFSLSGLENCAKSAVTRYYNPEVL